MDPPDTQQDASASEDQKALEIQRFKPSEETSQTLLSSSALDAQYKTQLHGSSLTFQKLSAEAPIPSSTHDSVLTQKFACDQLITPSESCGQTQQLRMIIPLDSDDKPALQIVDKNKVDEDTTNSDHDLQQEYKFDAKAEDMNPQNSTNVLQFINEPQVTSPSNGQILQSEVTKITSITFKKVGETEEDLTYHEDEPRFQSTEDNHSQQSHPEDELPQDLEHIPVEVVDGTEVKNEEVKKETNLHLYGWGLNGCHQLGHLQTLSIPKFDNQNISSPANNILIPRNLSSVYDFLAEVKDVACGLNHTLVVTKSNKLYAMGSNQKGQLGMPVSQQEIIHPVEVSLKLDRSWQRQQFSIDIQAVKTSGTHSLLFCHLVSPNCKPEKIVLATGLNDRGQLGLSSTDESSGHFLKDSFTECQVLTNYGVLKDTQFVALFCNKKYSGVVLGREGEVGGEVWIWGDDSSVDSSRSTVQKLRKLILPPEVQTEGGIESVDCTQEWIYIKSYSGAVFKGKPGQKVEQLKIDFKAKFLSCSESKAVLVSRSNQIYTLQDFSDEMTELEVDGDGKVNLKSAYAGNDFIIGLDFQGRIFGQGNNKHGELGTGDSYPRSKLSQIRIFNNQQELVRCSALFPSQSFTLGLFEQTQASQLQSARVKSIRSQGSMHSRNSVTVEKPLDRAKTEGLSTQHKPYIMSSQIKNFGLHNVEGSHSKNLKYSSIKPLTDHSQNMDSSRLENLMKKSEERQAKIDQTDQALKKYRMHSIQYKRNVLELQSVVDPEASESHPRNRSDVPRGQMNTLELSNQKKLIQISAKRQSAISQNQDLKSKPFASSLLKELRNSQNSPDIHVSKIDPECQNFEEKTFDNMAANKFSFSQLQHKFDENKVELQKYRKDTQAWQIERERYKNFNMKTQITSPPDTLERNLQRLENYISVENVVGNPVNLAMTQSSNMASVRYEPNPRIATSTDKNQQILMQDQLGLMRQLNVQAKTLRNQAHSFIPTITDVSNEFSAEMEQTRQPRHAPPNSRTRERNLAEIMQRTISDTSSLGGKSKSKDANLSYSAVQHQTSIGMPPAELHAQSISGASSIQYVNALHKKPMETSQEYGLKMPMQNKTASLQHYSSQQTSTLNQQSHQQLLKQIFDSGEVVSREVHKGLMDKLNKYKRKLKKYMGRNQDLKQNNGQLILQNQRLIQAGQQSKQGESQVQSHLKQVEQQMREMQDSYMDLLREKDTEIAALSKENMSLINDLAQRDQKHLSLEQKIFYIEEEISNLPDVIQGYKEQNQRLHKNLQRAVKKYRGYKQNYKELKQAVQQEMTGVTSETGDQKLRLQFEQLLQENSELVSQMQAKDQHISYLQQQTAQVRQEANLQIQNMSAQMTANLHKSGEQELKKQENPLMLNELSEENIASTSHGSKEHLAQLKHKQHHLSFNPSNGQIDQHFSQNFPLHTLEPQLRSPSSSEHQKQPQSSLVTAGTYLNVGYSYGPDLSRKVEERTVVIRDEQVEGRLNNEINTNSMPLKAGVQMTPEDNYGFNQSVPLICSESQKQSSLDFQTLNRNFQRALGQGRGNSGQANQGSCTSEMAQFFSKALNQTNQPPFNLQLSHGAHPVNYNTEGFDQEILRVRPEKDELEDSALLNELRKRSSFNFSNLSGDEQQKVLEYLRENSRSASRSRAMSSKDRKKIRNAKAQLKQFKKYTHRDQQSSDDSPEQPRLPIESPVYRIPSEEREKNIQNLKNRILNKITNKTNTIALDRVEKEQRRQKLEDARRSRQESSYNQRVSFSPVRSALDSQKDKITENPRSKSQFAQKQDTKGCFASLIERISVQSKHAGNTSSQLHKSVDRSLVEQKKQIPKPPQQDRVSDYLAQSKDWYTRRGRSDRDSAEQISQKYLQAFKGLSAELKKKIYQSQDRRLQKDDTPQPNQRMTSPLTKDCGEMNEFKRMARRETCTPEAGTRTLNKQNLTSEAQLLASNKRAWLIETDLSENNQSREMPSFIANHQMDISTNMEAPQGKTERTERNVDIPRQMLE